MRVLVVLTLLLALLVPPPAHAAGGALLEDAAGDSQLAAEAAGLPLPGQAGAGGDFAANADVLSLTVAETEDDFILTVALASLKGEPAASYQRVWFTWSNQDFVVTLGTFSSATLGARGQSSWLYAVDGDEWDAIAGLAITVDADKGTLSTSVPKVYVMDGKDRNPGRGDSLTGIRVDSRGFSVNMGLLQTTWVDAMPDDEGASATFTFQMGDYSTGTLRLSSPERVRVSNGGSTTFVFLAELANTAEAAQEFELALADLPEGWNASVQSPVKVPGKESRTVAILASVPFGHTHGGYDAFNLTVTGKTDPASGGRMRFGVLHTPIPQPAGHHADLYLHAAPRSSNPINDAFNHVEPYGRGYMNTVSERTAEEAPFASVNWYDGNPGWYVPLSPGLRMGLDFDVEKTGSLVGTFENMPQGDVEITAELWLFRPDGEDVLLAEAEPVTLTAEARAPLPFSLTLTPTEDADYVPHQPEQYLSLVIEYDHEMDRWIGGPMDPRLLTDGFKLSLPLNEYHDKLTGVADAAAVLDLKAEGPVEKAGRPGTIVTYVFELVNGGSTDDRFEVDLAGADNRHAQVIPRGAVALAAKETKRVTVAVSIPSDAKEGEELEVLLFAHGVDDPSKTAIARTKTRVSLGSDAVDDESAVLIAARDAERGAPGPGLALVALAGAGAALLARRRA